MKKLLLLTAFVVGPIEASHYEALPISVTLRMITTNSQHEKVDDLLIDDITSSCSISSTWRFSHCTEQSTLTDAYMIIKIYNTKSPNDPITKKITTPFNRPYKVLEFTRTSGDLVRIFVTPKIPQLHLYKKLF